ncbi:Activator of Hsp90 ATPase-like protein [Flavobacterium saliperosum S13]|nr:SRPBCC domain-containing protein [Flavobacterium saliperosum]ESU24135.1 Activator of Hsp90 ATPase-like protein [Flavobacterium saliperosum S13]
MKKMQFSISINAPKEKVWQTLWNDDTYQKWTSVFSEGSKAVSDWKEGSRIHFLNENNDGMYSTIDKRVDNEIMNFKHIGNIKNGVELPLDATTESWSGSTENYTLKEANGVTTLTVEMDIVADYQDYFNEKFPIALNKVKELAEA